MGCSLVVLFILTPIVEMYLLLTVGDLISPWPTIALVLLTAMIGVKLLRSQGTATLTRARQRMAMGELPTRETADGLMLAVAGLLLLTPGFVTDAVGFALLTPLVRQAITSWVAKRIQVVGTLIGVSTKTGVERRTPGQEPGVTLEGNYERKD